MGIKLICLIGVIFLMLTDNQKPLEDDGGTYEDKYGKATLFGGYWWHFEDGDDDITVHGAASSKEYIYINDELVSEKVGLKFSSEQEFTYKGAEYRVEMKLLRALTAEMDCLVYKNGNLIGQKAVSLFDGTLKGALKKIWPIFIFGFLVGAVGAGVGIATASGKPFDINLQAALISGGIVTATGLVLAYFLRKKS